MTLSIEPSSEAGPILRLGEALSKNSIPAGLGRVGQCGG